MSHKVCKALRERIPNHVLCWRSCRTTLGRTGERQRSNDAKVDASACSKAHDFLYALACVRRLRASTRFDGSHAAGYLGQERVQPSWSTG